MKSLQTLTCMTALIATLGFSAMSHAQTSMYKNQDNTVTFHSAGEGQNQVRNGSPVSKTYVKNTDGTVTFQETQVAPAEGQPAQQPVVIAPPVAVPYPMQPYQPMVAPYTRQVQPQPNILPSGVVDTNAVVRVENLKNATTDPKPTNSLGTFNRQ